MRGLAVHLVALWAICGGVFFYSLDRFPLWDRDEPRNAGAAIEMLERNDWVVPYFNGEVRDAKPVLLYWLIMGAYQVFGVGEFGARFFSAVAATGTVTCTYLIGRRIWNARAGGMAALALATTLMMNVAAHAATPDSLLVFCVSLALCLYVRGTFVRTEAKSVDDSLATCSRLERDFPRLGTATLMFAALGVGLLAKGPVAFLLPMAAIGLFRLIVRLPKSDAPPVATTRGAWLIAGLALGWVAAVMLVEATLGLKLALLVGAAIGGTLWFVGPPALTGWLRIFAPLHFWKTLTTMRPFYGALVACVVAAPWYVWVGIRTDGEFLKTFFLYENLARASTAMEGHDGGLWFYPGTILVGAFPWSVLALPIVLATIRRLRDPEEPSRQALLFAISWFAVVVGLFSLAQTKLPSYVTPCYPALALLCGHFLSRMPRPGFEPLPWVRRLAFGSMIAVGIGMLVGLPFTLADLLPNSIWLASLGLIPLLIGVACLYFAEQHRWSSVRNVMAFGAFAWTMLVFSVALAEVGKYQRCQGMLSTVRVDYERQNLVAFARLEPSWVFYSRHRIPLFAGEEFERLKSHLQERPETLVITTRTLWEEMPTESVRDFEAVMETPYFLRDETLVLLELREASSLALAGDASDGATNEDPLREKGDAPVDVARRPHEIESTR
ncbi:MAG TPA: glycosyltransferase family 39 protein [Pirellulaceae bacterium]|jgi:4-amino-4-deoxy-L-arabinose transferase-like glycosyltransferase|nr:glycosyltransferase family 39 protein [Pirellulaceae bacterium]